MSSSSPLDSVRAYDGSARSPTPCSGEGWVSGAGAGHSNCWRSSEACDSCDTPVRMVGGWLTRLEGAAGQASGVVVGVGGEGRLRLRLLLVLVVLRLLLVLVMDVGSSAGGGAAAPDVLEKLSG